MKKMNGLGRGLDAIFLDNEAETKPHGGVEEISLSLIDPRSEQPRKNFDPEALASLAASIEANGLFQPILVREMPTGRYQIIAGERRFRASKLAKLSAVPAIVLDKDDKQTAEIALVENIQRENLNPMEEAAGYRTLAEEYGMTQEELAATVGKSRSAVANAMRLLDLPAAVLPFVIDGSLSAGHARALLGLSDAGEMLALAEKIKAQGLSVRETEAEVKRLSRKKPQKTEGETKPPVVDYLRELELRVQGRLGRQTRLDAKKKTVTLFYEDNDDLEELLTAICGKEFMEEMI